MEIIPAIDIRSGHVVRLYQGNFAQETAYSTDPVAIALEWERQGAEQIHVVDLDGARTGRLSNTVTIQQILEAVQVRVQVGGGLRRLSDVDRLLSLGASRIVLGTAAIASPELISRCLKLWGGSRIVTAVDERAGRVAIRGWQDSTMTTPLDLIGKMQVLGVSTFLVTNIERDGTLSEPDFSGLANIRDKTGASILASGGISTTSHVQRLANLGIEGAIVGKALYTGMASLSKLIEAAG